MEAQNNPAKRFQPPVAAFFDSAATSLSYFVFVEDWKSHPADNEDCSQCQYRHCSSALLIHRVEGESQRTPVFLAGFCMLLLSSYPCDDLYLIDL